ncbi:MAG: CoA transferase, partial [Hyphomicrobiales bacterium]|nr:CoA transferase [Hyphomicrobiales bacterium]
ECGLHFMAGAIFAYHRDGIIAGRSGNRDMEAAPHGAYECRDGRWLALSCWSDDEFTALTAALDCPAMAEDPRFAGIESRRVNAQALDEALAGILRERDAEKTAEILQRAGVSAYPVNSIADLFSDPQLDERQTWRRRKHQEIGEQAYLMPGFDLSSTPADISHAAPLLGGDNDVVFKDFLGLGEDEFDAYAAKEAFN